MRVNVFHGENFAYSVDMARALEMAKAPNVEVIRKRRRGAHERTIQRLIVRDTPTNDRGRRDRRAHAVAVAEDSQTTYREHIGGETSRPAVIIQHKRAHLGDGPFDVDAHNAYLEILAAERAKLMSKWRSYPANPARRQTANV